jgi:hypothetical protein
LLLRWGGGATALALAIAQFFPPARTNPPVVGEIDAPAEVATILRQACYDCHSNETRWPWYSRVSPFSWWLVHHVEEGREHLNFSEWSTLQARRRRHAYEEIDGELASGKMPLSSYVILHRRGRLSDDQRATLRRWARQGF